MRAAGEGGGGGNAAVDQTYSFQAALLLPVAPWWFVSSRHWYSCRRALYRMKASAAAAAAAARALTLHTRLLCLICSPVRGAKAPHGELNSRLNTTHNTIELPCACQPPARVDLPA